MEYSNGYPLYGHCDNCGVGLTFVDKGKWAFYTHVTTRRRECGSKLALLNGKSRP